MTKQAKGVITALLFGLLFFTIFQTLLPLNQALLIGLITLLVVLWTNESLPLGVVSILPIILFPSFNLATTDEITSQYSKTIIFLFLGGFMLAIAVAKTRLHEVIAHKTLNKFPKTPRGILFALTFISGILSALLANTTTTLLLIPLAIYLTDDVRFKLRIALAIAYGSSIGGIITPIGTAPNAIMLELMSQYELPTIPFFTWMLLTFPLALLMFSVVAFILSLGTKDIAIDTKTYHDVITPEQRKLTYILLGLVFLLFINAPIRPYYDGLGLNEKGILLGFGLLMFMPPVSLLTWKDSKEIPYEIIFLFGAGFSIAYAVMQTGLSNTIASQILSFTSLPTIVLIALIAAIVTFTTEITSNTALTSMMLPVIYEVTKTAGLDITLFMMVATIAASYAFMLPISTPPNAIAISSGVVPIKTMLRYGVWFNFIGVFLITLVAMLIWRQFL